MNPRPLPVGPVLVIMSLVAVTLAFWPTFHDLLGIGAPSEEYTHRILVIPIFLVAVWRLRFELTTLPIRVFWPGLIALAGAGMVWLAGELTFIRLFTETAVIAMVPIVVLTVFGCRWLWALSFPLFFLLFVVPIQGALVNLQVDLTAKFAYLGLLATGIPVHREGPYFELPTGKWSIAAACSGVEYLSACMMLAALYAWTMYTTTRKRALFMAGAVVVALTGNWLRAYLTILIAHLSDNRFLRHGHGTFGWLLFAALLFIYCAIGWRFRDHEALKDAGNNPANARLQPGSSRSSSALKLVTISVIVLAALFVWPLLKNAFAREQRSGPIEIANVSPTSGWSTVENPSVDWTPTLTNPSRQRVQSFEKNGHKVDVFVGVFAGQTWASKLVTSVNGLIAPESSRWSLVERGSASVPHLEGDLEVKTGVVLGGDKRIMAWQWYWIGGRSTANDVKAKLEQLRVRLGGNYDSADWITIYTLVDSSPVTAANTLTEFMRDMSEPLERALAQTARQ